MDLYNAASSRLATWNASSAVPAGAGAGTPAAAPTATYSADSLALGSPQDAAALQAQIAQVQQQLEAIRQQIAVLEQSLDATPAAPAPQAPAPQAPTPATPPAPKPKPKPAAPKPKPAPKPSPRPESKTVTVKSGDSLSAIAQRELGSAGRWHEIYDLNRDKLSNPDLIQPGMVLKLPGGAHKSAPAPAPAHKPHAPAAHGINTNRNAIYLAQPNGWTCGPTSLTMALAAWGVRPANLNTMNEMIGLTHANSNDGVPGNASLIANAAQKVGMQARFVADGSPARVREALKAGHGVVLNGSLGVGGHFIYVAGLNPDGSFIIDDPARSGITRMSDSELNHFANTYGNPRGFAEIWK